MNIQEEIRQEVEERTLQTIMAFAKSFEETANNIREVTPNSETVYTLQMLGSVCERTAIRLNAKWKRHDNIFFIDI